MLDKLRRLATVEQREVYRSVMRALRAANPLRARREADALYRMLYKLSHDLDNALDLAALQTRNAFANQWTTLKEGAYLLSDPWFKENVARILAEEELQLAPAWFPGKTVLDVGCGNGRWSYGFAQHGCQVTAVDVNQIAVEETRQAISGFDVAKQFFVSPVEELSKNLAASKYDLVFSWGVLHHCKSFTKALSEVVSFVGERGILYLYLYGRETMSHETDIDHFKERVRFNSLWTDAARDKFLREKAHNHPERMHNVHDMYAPLINRRLEFKQVEALLRGHGFTDIVRTIDGTELFIRAMTAESKAHNQEHILPRRLPPYWFQHH